MGVVVEGKAIVPDVVRRVDGFGHGTYSHCFNKILLALAFHVLKQLVEGAHEGVAVAEQYWC